MFEGVPDQFHQFVASRTSTLPLPLSFPSVVFQGSSNTTTTTTNFSSFDPYIASNPTHHVPPHQVLQPNFFHQLHQASSPPNKHDHHHKQGGSNSMAMNFEIDRQRSIITPPDSALPWSNDEVLALLRIRSSLENWPPEFTWEYVSRKLAQLGFKRSAEKCKEKFEEEIRFFNINIDYNKGFRGFNELEELCRHGNHQQQQQQHQQQQQQHNPLKENNNKIDNNNSIIADCDQEKNKKRDSEEEDNKVGQNSLEAAHEDSRIDQDDEQNLVLNISNDHDEKNKQDQIAADQKSKKRKRQKKFEMFKSFCEDFVSKMMAQQEEMHNKLLEDMMRREEEKVAKEEAWKKQEFDRINKEIEIRAREQASVGDRQTTIINYLKKFTLQPSSSSSTQDNSSSSSIPPPHQSPNSQTTINDQTNEKSHPITPTSLTQNPSSMSNQNFQSTPSSLPTYKVHALKSATSSDHKDDIGKRWPRDEVLALINLRCKLYNGNEYNKEGVSTKAPLWERISQGMMELGYKRSAKRCKEKWENINKYFRKTKDTNKKRSIDSRTCPYFHQLSALYNQGKLVLPPDGPGNHSASPDNGSVLPETMQTSTSSQNGSTNSTMHDSTVGEGEKSMVHQVPPFDFEF